VRAYKATADKLAVQRVTIEQHKVYDESGMSMLPMLLTPIVQVPVALGMFKFFSVKHLCALLLEQFHRGGVSSLPGLTVLDPYYVLHRDRNTVYCIYT
jgi:hypothetical protein